MLNNNDKHEAAAPEREAAAPECEAAEGLLGGIRTDIRVCGR